MHTLRIMHTQRTIINERTMRTNGTTIYPYIASAHSRLTHVLMMPAIPKSHGQRT